MRLLVVEDNDINREILSRFLARGGHRAISAANGRQAVQSVAAGDIDAVLMDLYMPDIDGFEATRMIRALPGVVGRTPIVALTADPTEPVRRRAADAGVDAFLAKPVDWDALAETLRRLALAVDPAGTLGLPPRSGQDLVDGGLDPLLDPSQIDQFIERVGRDQAAAFNARLLERLRTDLADMNAALTGGMWDRIGLLAHRAKGSCGMLGWRRCAAVLDRLQRVEGEARPTIEALLGALEAALDETRRALGTPSQSGHAP